MDATERPWDAALPSDPAVVAAVKAILNGPGEWIGDGLEIAQLGEHIVEAVHAADLGSMNIYGEIRAEREAAHVKHGETSMESAPVDEMFRAVILGEEVGEVAEVCYLLWSAALTAKASYVQKAMNDGRHDGAVDLAKLRRELVQVATMAAAWADRIELSPIT